MDLKELLGDAYKEGMTFEEIAAALKNVTPPDPSAAEVDKLKNALSKANSQAAAFKKQLQGMQSEEEQKAAAQQEEHEKLVQENADLKRAITLSEKKAKLLGMGYDEKLAESTAKAMVDGDMDTVMANQSIYLEAQKKGILADKMKSTPRPATGSESPDGVDYQKKIEEAQASGNYAAAAYYTRLQAQETQQETGGQV